MTEKRKSGGKPEIRVEQWPIGRLVPYARNPRKNDDPDVIGRMAGSIREYGFKVPVLARSDGEVIDGHLRLKAAASLGMESVPVTLCDDWTEAQVKAFRLMAYASARWAPLDRDLAKLELLDLREIGLEDLGLTGLDAAEIDRLLAIGTAPEDFPEYGEAIPTTYQCPKCGYEWSGKPGGGTAEKDGDEPRA
jgi:ParB-like chromosome segregation protein Spo0J